MYRRHFFFECLRAGIYCHNKCLLIYQCPTVFRVGLTVLSEQLEIKWMFVESHRGWTYENVKNVSEKNVI